MKICLQALFLSLFSARDRVDAPPPPAARAPVPAPPPAAPPGAGRRAPRARAGAPGPPPPPPPTHAPPPPGPPRPPPPRRPGVRRGLYAGARGRRVRRLQQPLRAADPSPVDAGGARLSGRRLPVHRRPITRPRDRRRGLDAGERPRRARPRAAADHRQHL